jgi:SAM-dependent methyltransferase
VGTLAESWDAVARAYDVYWGPRFMPYAAAAIAAAAEHALPPGPVLAPCCGPGRELVAMAAALPGRQVVGLDVSAGMIALARIRCAGSPWLHAEVADCARLAPHGPAAAIVSVFGFQQLPDPPAALTDWCRALAPGGVAAVCFWPGSGGAAGPYDVARAVLARHVAPRPTPAWEDRLPAAVADGGAEVLADLRPCFEIGHESPAEFWYGLVEAGPWQGLHARVGADAVAAMRAEFLAAHPPGPIREHPIARLLVVRR